MSSSFPVPPLPPSKFTSSPSPAYPTLQTLYPWTQSPFICSAPLRAIATSPLAVAVSLAGGLGFIGLGDDLGTLDSQLTEARKRLCDAGWPNSTRQETSISKEVGITTDASDQSQSWPGDDILPVGVGFFAWGVSPQDVAPILRKHRPAAIWLFAPRDETYASLSDWAEVFCNNDSEIEKAYRPHIWLQVGTVTEALGGMKALGPALTVLVVQGNDAGGHGLSQSASLITLLPEVTDIFASDSTSHKPFIVAAGGIADGRGAVAAFALGADGLCMGTRYLASHEAVVTRGYREAVLTASDGGITTVRTKLYDTLRGTTKWPPRYGGRGVTNASWDDFLAGKMTEEENKRLYEEAMKQGDQGWGLKGRMTTYAGTAVGLVRKAQSAGEITNEVRNECRILVKRMPHKL